MSNTTNPSIMEQVMSVMDKMAGNPNSKLDATNFGDVMSNVTDVLISGYRKVDAYNSSTSLTAAEQPATVSSAPAPVPAAAPAPVAETAPAQVTEIAEATVAPAIAPQPERTAAKKTATNTIKSAPAKKTGKAANKAAPAPAPVTPAPVEVDQNEDVATADSMIREHGSARQALAYLDANKKRGRKTAWHKIIEERAEKELREAPTMGVPDADAIAQAMAAGKTREEASAELTGYKFADISRTPIMDPEKALVGTKMTCLIDGAKRTMMSRYLDSKFGMSPEEYRAHFNLRSDYPMTTDSYKNEKRRLAEVQQLGKRRPAQAEAAAPAEAATTTRKTRTRKAA